MTDVTCPFNEPLPPGRRTKPVPKPVRKELASLEVQKNSTHAGPSPASGPFDNFRALNSIQTRLNQIEVGTLCRPPCARIAYHSGWRYSIETPELLAAEAKGRPARRSAVIEELIAAFASAKPLPWPFKEKVPEGVNVFDVPVEIRNVLSLACEREKAAAKLIGGYGSTDDGGMWFRRNILADALEYIANDFVRAVYSVNDRHSVNYFADFKCTFTFR